LYRRIEEGQLEEASGRCQLSAGRLAKEACQREPAGQLHGRILGLEADHLADSRVRGQGAMPSVVVSQKREVPIIEVSLRHSE
jgi:hypothetical protein